MKAVILAGGKGTRLGELAAAMPKPLVPVAGVALLEHQLRLLARCGAEEVFILSGYLAGQIRDFAGDGGKYGLKIRHIAESAPLGTAGALRQMQGVAGGDFIVLYGDIMLDMDLRRLLDFHKAKAAACTLVIHPNDHPFDSDLVAVDGGSRITAVHSKPHQPGLWLRNLANTGVCVMSEAALNCIPEGVKSDFVHDILPGMVSRLPVYGYATPEYLKDIGTPERLAKAERDLLSGKIAAFNLKNKRRAVFLDRDGVINREKGLISRPEDFELLPGAAEAVSNINAAGFLAVVATNQPVVARSLCGIETVELIHRKMETLLGEKGAYLDAVYYCPHHPDKGYPGENAAYKIDCACRKPKPGMLLRAAAELNIDLSGSYMAGDSKRDLDCARAAGVKAIAVGGLSGGDIDCADLAAAAEIITGAGK
ncbi:MAG: HAD-IIIA family hydrolase [Elusimicrobiales bacterium]